VRLARNREGRRLDTVRKAGRPAGFRAVRPCYRPFLLPESL